MARIINRDIGCGGFKVREFEFNNDLAPVSERDLKSS